MKFCSRSILGAVARRRFVSSTLCAVAASVVALASAHAQAQGAAYPNRPISFVVTQSPGSTSDLVRRVLAAELTARLGQNVIVENKPGAGGTIAMTGVARAKNDGYTLGLGSPGTMATATAIYPNLPYDPLKDFAPVILFATSSNVLVVPGNSPIVSVSDLARRMKEAGKAFQYSSPGNGSAQHLEGALLAKLVGAKAEHVPYRGTPTQLTALMSGEVDFGFSTMQGAANFVKEGRLRALTSTQPSAVLPHVPSFSSLGLADLDKTGVWFGVVVPSGTPDAVIQTLHAAFAKSLSDPSVQSKLTAVGLEPVTPPASAAEFAKFVRDQVPFWAGLVKNSGAVVK